MQRKSRCIAKEVSVASRYARQNCRPQGLLATIAVLLITAGLRESYSVSMPLAVAALLITAIWPVKTWLDRILPSRVSYAATALILLSILVAFVSAVYFSAAQIVGAFGQNWS